MDKSHKKGIIMRHEPTGLYFSKSAGLTDNLFSAMSFGDADNAVQMIHNSYYGPEDPQNYKMYQVITTKELIENVQNES